MTREHLLEAVGLLDDGLIQEAEQPAGKPRSSGGWRRWAALAACVAVVAVAAIGYQGLGRMGAGGGAPDMTGGESQAASSAGGGQTEGQLENTAPAAPGDASFNNSREVLIVIVQEGDRVWSYQHWYEEDRVLDALPEGCRSLGRVGTYEEREDCVYTDMGQFPDAPLWIAGEGMDGPVYLELPQGGYLECQRA